MDLTQCVFILNILDLNFKKTYHHYVGFYSSCVLSSCEPPSQVTVGLIDFPLDGPTVVNYSFDGHDLIVQEQLTFLSSSNFVMAGYSVKTDDKPRGIITNSYQNKYYPVCGEFYKPFFMVSNLSKVTVTSKSKMIAYAGEQFDNKNELVEYIRQPHPKSSREAVIYRNGNHTQVIVFEDGLNVVNYHLRSPLVTEYNIPVASNLIIS